MATVVSVSSIYGTQIQFMTSMRHTGIPYLSELCIHVTAVNKYHKIFNFDHSQR